jgi:GWxTD domain-containing protein
MTSAASMKELKLISLRLAGFFLVLLVAFSCGSVRSLSDDNIADLYDREAIKIRSAHQIHHREANLSVFYLRVSAKDLTYAINPENLKNEATAIIELKALPHNPQLTRAVDSAMVRLSDVSPDNEFAQLHTAISLALPDGYAYRLILTITDVNSGKQQKSLIRTSKTTMTSRDNFLVFETERRIPLYADYITRPSRLRIKNNQNKDMTVRYYNRNFPLPPPPFSNYNPPPFKYQADSIFTIRATSDFSILEATKAGFYHILTDDNQKEGKTIFTFPDPFPYVSEPHQMFESLRYLTTEWEHREMRQRSNLRQGIEKFWIDCAGSQEKARELIELYYGRVEEANQFFSSYVEGWKTDRGLIHIVYGKPNIIYKGPNAETWIYGEDKNVMSLTFNFTKVINPFTDNDFRLNRDENYKASWYRAIESWRKGRIYAN